MRNAEAYAALREIYKGPMQAANEELRDHGWDGAFEFVDLLSSNSSSTTELGFAAVALRAPGELDDLDLKLHPFSSTEFATNAEARQRLMAAWRGIDEQPGIGGSKREDETGDNYCLLALRVSEGVKGVHLALDVGDATYGEIVRSCDALINEFALFAFIAGFPQHSSLRDSNLVPRMSPRAVLRCLPWRRAIHECEGVPSDVFGVEPVVFDDLAGAVTATRREHEDLLGS